MSVDLPTPMPVDYSRHNGTKSRKLLPLRNEEEAGSDKATTYMAKGLSLQNHETAFEQFFPD